MKLNKKLQLGLLLVLYLTRSGRTTGASAAEGLRVSKSFLEQVARTLRLKGLIRSSRGPLGGYELIGEPTIGEVFAALSPVSLLSKTERTKNLTGGHERRALSHLAANLAAALSPILNRKVKNLGADLVAADTAVMNRLAPTARVN